MGNPRGRDDLHDRQEWPRRERDHVGRRLLRSGVGHRLVATTRSAVIGRGGETIVGKWAVGGKCQKQLSVVVIDPRALSGEDFYCDFSWVGRAGNDVQWSGRCNFGGTGYEPTKALARLNGSQLRYRFAGLGRNGPFVRCPGE